MAILKGKVGSFSIGEAFAVGITKSLAENVLKPVIGNGTFMSGGIKLAGAWGIPKMMSGTFGRVIGTALAVDGVEDMVTALFKGGGAQSATTGSGALI